jgi:hypothetical protein
MNVHDMEEIDHNVIESVIRTFARRDPGNPRETLKRMAGLRAEI